MDNTLLIIIVCSVVAFLFVLIIIFRKDVFSFLSKKINFKFKKKKTTEKKDEPSKKEKVSYTVEDFKPINPLKNEQVRDSSLDALFNDYKQEELSDNFIGDENQDQVDNTEPFSFDSKEVSGDFDYEKFLKSIQDKNSNDEKTLAEKIQELPPELKVLIIDNLLGRKDDNF